ncbi:hypothetical protein [Belliella aquatica]|uniref:Uncharacterized protein n=1 Tax=Belliella aquatica TaxID=1323734 RepID=A0ABQ1M6S9_9BACT|nr:hypothetical protein [Belliella aquatica]MCH7404631.1 hypothetical protein [Belliella aquatica]GGC35370.1 hypothetical protein GCM10010993_12860 [Belliella aquatica]
MTDITNKEKHIIFNVYNSGKGKERKFVNESLEITELNKVLTSNKKKYKEWSFTENLHDVKDDAFVFRILNKEYKSYVEKKLESLCIPPNVTYDLDEVEKYTVLIYFFDNKICDKEVRKYVSKGFAKLLDCELTSNIQFKSHVFKKGTNFRIHNHVNTEFIIFHVLAEVGYSCSGRTGASLLSGEKKRRGSYIHGIVPKQSAKSKLINQFDQREDFFSLLKYKEAYLKKMIPRLDEIFASGNGNIRDLISLVSVTSKLINSNKISNNIIEKFLKKDQSKIDEILISVRKVFRNDFYPEILFYDHKMEKSYCISDLLKDMNKFEYFQTDTIHLMGLEEAENEMRNYLKKFIDIDNKKIVGDNDIHFLKAAAGIGKTEIIIKMRDSVIAVPTHNLKDETAKRLRKLFPEKEIRVSPEIPDFSKEVKMRVESLFESGRNSFVRTFLSNLTEDPTTENGTKEDQNLAKKYLEDLEHVNEPGEYLIITTHHKGLFSSFGKRLIIFDEDPYNLLLEQNSFDLVKLIRFANRFQDNSPERNAFNFIIEELNKTNYQEVRRFPQEIFSGLESNILKRVNQDDKLQAIVHFLYSHSYLKIKTKGVEKVNFIMKRAFPEDATCLILSATLSRELYQNLLGKEIGLNYLDISNVKHKGKIYQNSDFSYSKSQKETWDYLVKEKIKGRFVITFKPFKEEFNSKREDINFYFFNCSGYNGLKGKDIVVLGTPRMSPIRYKLIANVLGIPVENLNSSSKLVERNGRSVIFYSLNNPTLMNIELDLIEGELIQAIGRARALREENASVHVFTNFPLPQFVQIDEPNELEHNKSFYPVEIE